MTLAVQLCYALKRSLNTAGRCLWMLEHGASTQQSRSGTHTHPVGSQGCLWLGPTSAIYAYERLKLQVTGHPVSAPLWWVQPLSVVLSHSLLSVSVSLSFVLWGVSQLLGRCARVTADTWGFQQRLRGLQACESSTPVFLCWSWQTACSIMSGRVHTVGPESHTASSDKSQRNGYWERHSADWAVPATTLTARWSYSRHRRDTVPHMVMNCCWTMT